MEAQVSEILENILGLLALEGSFEVEENKDGVFVSIDTEDAGKLIGKNGETLAALQLIVNQIVSKAKKESSNDKKSAEEEGTSKRVIIDISNWRRSKEEELAHKARLWAEKVKETNQPLELEPMPSWQRRVIHVVIQETEGVESESFGEGRDRHLVIRPEGSKKSESAVDDDQKES